MAGNGAGEIPQLVERRAFKRHDNENDGLVCEK